MIRHCILGWIPSKNQALKEELIKLGVLEKDIEFITERKSRSYVQNKCFKAIPQHYKYICLYDSDIILDGTDFIKSLKEDLDNNSDVGASIVPVYQFAENEIPFQLEAPVVDGSYLKNVNFLTTFNIIMFRRSLLNKGPLFDEDFWGNQLLDVDCGFEIGNRGFRVVADLRHSVGHVTADYVAKNICYHAVVARSRNVLREKWIGRENWNGVDDFNKNNPDRRILNIEELTHSSEASLIKYICEWDSKGFELCWLNPRFKDLNAIHSYYNNMNNLKNNTQDKYKLAHSPEGVGFAL